MFEKTVGSAERVAVGKKMFCVERGAAGELSIVGTTCAAARMGY